MGIPSAIRYLRECYREDNVRGGYWNLFGGRVEHQIIFDGVENVADGLADSLVIPPGNDVEHISRDATLKAGELEFLYGTLFFTGRLVTSGGGEDRLVCAPLLLYPLKFVDGDGSRIVAIDHSGRRLNSALLDLLADAFGRENFTDQVAEEIGFEAMTEGGVLRLEALLRDQLPGLDLSGMNSYPELLDAKQFASEYRAAAGAKEETLTMLSASAAALWPKSNAVRGIVSELGKMAKGASPSPPVRAVLEGSGTLPTTEETDDWAVDTSHVPAVLSAAQKAILSSARTSPLTLANGPPGTGKSFTIAAVALDHLARGESVLVASKMDQAVDVVGDKIEGTLGAGGCVVRAGKSNYLSQLKKDLENLLSGMRPIEGGSWVDNGRTISAFAKNARRISRSAKAIADGNFAELRDSAAIAGDETGLLKRIGRWFARKRTSRRALPHVHVDELEMQLDQKISLAAKVLSQMRQDRLLRCLTKSRPELQRFLKALRSRRGAAKEALFSETGFVGILNAFPIWLVKLADVHRVLPLREQLFDLAIVDEATQCDIPSCLPILQRARRVLVAGDLRQLRHISFLSRERQRRLAAEHGVDPESPFANYREVSLLDLVSDSVGSASQVGFLNEHFRSRPAIIGFSNQQFYSGGLNVMTEQASRDERKCLWVHRCEGQRDRSGVNATEIDAILAHLLGLLEQERGFRDAECRSVGVLSPFRAQVDAIRDALADKLEAASFDRLTRAHKLIVATAHGFQGEERDIMLLSLAAGTDGAAHTLRFLSRPDVLNVAVTRAKVEQHIYYSFEPASLPPNSLLRGYMNHVARNSGDAESSPGLEDESTQKRRDPFAEQVAAAVEEMGARVLYEHDLAGLRFDLIAIGAVGAVGIDLLGYPGSLEAAFPIERYKMFRRAGMRIFPLSYCQWVVKKEESLTALREALTA